MRIVKLTMKNQPFQLFITKVRNQTYNFIGEGSFVQIYRKHKLKSIHASLFYPELINSTVFFIHRHTSLVKFLCSPQFVVLK